MARQVTREDLADSIAGLTTLVNVKLDGVGDKIIELREDLRKHAEANIDQSARIEHRLSTEIGRVDLAHQKIQADLDDLKTYKWKIIGAIAALGAAGETVIHFILGKK